MSNSFVTAAALLTNAVGLHARPSVKLTQLAKSFAARVEVVCAGGPWVDARAGEDHARQSFKGDDAAFPCGGADAAPARL